MIIHLTAFFGCLYYAALRSAEASHLTEQRLRTAGSRWGLGMLHLSGTLLSVGKE